MGLIDRKKRLILLNQDFNLLYEAYNLSFDGTNYIDTGAYLFNQQNINRDFEFIAEGILAPKSVNNATIICAKHDSKAYGFFVRTDASTSTQYKGTIHVKFDPNVVSMVIRRVSGVITLSGTNISNPAVKFTNNVFDWPLVLGCAIDNDGNPWRYATGTIEHVKVRWI